MPSNNTENIYSSEYGGSGQPIDADRIAYDNTTSGLSATDAQGAIDELAGDIADISQMPVLPSDSADGTYVLKATMSSGTITYAWVVEV